MLLNVKRPTKSYFRYMAALGIVFYEFGRGNGIRPNGDSVEEDIYIRINVILSEKKTKISDKIHFGTFCLLIVNEKIASHYKTPSLSSLLAIKFCFLVVDLVVKNVDTSFKLVYKCRVRASKLCVPTGQKARRR